MKIKRKLIETIRIRTDRAEKLKNKAYEISMLAKETVQESDLINYLIDEELEKITLKNNELTLKNL